MNPVEQVLASLSHFIPETILTVGFLVVIIIDLIARNRIVAGTLALVTLGGAFVATLGQIGTSSISFTGTHVIDPALGMIAVDGFAVFFKLLVCLSSIVIVFFAFTSGELKEGNRSMGEYYGLLLSATLGMFLMAGATDILMMYISLELLSISSYILAGFTKEVGRSSEASLKYVIYGAISSGLMLYGFSILYGITGTTNIYQISYALSTQGTMNSPALLVSGILILAGFGYKISAAPFHFWTPDVYEGAPITITAFLSVGSKAAGFAMLIRYVLFTYPVNTIESFHWDTILYVVAVVTMTLGNLSALSQSNIKRMLAYSSIAHAGYMLMGLVVLSASGVASIMIYFVTYMAMNLGAFYIVMMIADKIGSEEIDDYRGLGKRLPVVGAALGLFLISLTGLPPTIGFIGKLYLFSALIEAKFYWLVAIAALNSVISLYYYVRILKAMYLSDSDGVTDHISFSTPVLAIMIVIVVPVVYFGLFPPPIVSFARDSLRFFGVM